MKMDEVKRIHKPQFIKVQPWDNIEEHFIHLKGHHRLVELVRHIISCGLSERLFAFTSVDKLVVGIYDPMERDREALHIEFDRQNQKWYFKYLSKPNVGSEFERLYDAEKGIEKFDNFIRIMRW